MIEFRNITLKVQGQTLLVGADMDIAAGEKVVLRGASGCGKSSLLKSVMGAMPLSGGTIYIDGIALSAATLAEIRSRIAFIGQEPVLGAESVREALLLPFTFKAHKGRMPAESRIPELLERLHLTADILAKPCSRISGGEKQRIAVIRALLLNKTIFLVDEVTSALDPESRAAVMDELFRPDLTVLSVSHDPEWIGRCDRIVECGHGQLSEVQHDD